MLSIALTWTAGMFVAAPTPADSRYFEIEVIDAQTGRGVPLVELRTVNAIRHYTDSNGIVAFHEPGLMNRDVFFFVESHGYEFPKDGFGMAGRVLQTTPGSRTRLEINRVNIAERLYRLTGGGIYRDSVLLGRDSPIHQPVLNGLVLGQDSVFTIVHRRRLYWFWGDTARPGYPLGNFHMSGATSRLPRVGGLDPTFGVDLTYFANEHGFSREMARMPGDGPTWADAFVVLADDKGSARMYGAYAKIRPGKMEVHDRGLMRLNDSEQRFENIASLPLDAPAYPKGHALRHTVDGTDYVFFATPYPLTRVPATAADYRRLSAYETFTLLAPGSRGDDLRIDRDKNGTIRYGWKSNTAVVTPQQQTKLIKEGKLAPEEALFHLQDMDTGKAVLAHSGSVYWNPYRRRWCMITCELFGTSVLGETWYAEADAPIGPWVYARKIVTHETYSFYNPKQHPMFDQQDGRIIFFEGTYTHAFSGNPDRTPRYDYNQILYKLDLADPRLNLPVPVYRIADEDGIKSWATIRELDAASTNAAAVFFALDRPGEETIPVFAFTDAAGKMTLEIRVPATRAEADPPTPLFYALPGEAKTRPATVVPLFESLSADGSRRHYSTEERPAGIGSRRSATPLCYVWRSPVAPGLSRRFLASRGRPTEMRDRRSTPTAIRP